MNDTRRLPIWVLCLLVLLAGSVLACAWWDWSFPGLAQMAWRGERIYPLFWRRLGWMVALVAGGCLGLWGLGGCVTSREAGAWSRAARPFYLAFLVLPYFGRYTLHPLGVQQGSSVWTWGLVVVTAAILSLSVVRIVRTFKAVSSLQRWAPAVVGVCTLIYVLVFGLLSSARHVSFRTHALDMGTMDQAVWNTVQGRILERTPLYRDPAQGSRYENRLLDAKLELVLVPIAALYGLWSSPLLLLVLQTLFLAAGAISLYQLAVQRLTEAGQERPAWPAAWLSLAYLVYLPLHYVNMADFHPSALMIPMWIAAWRAMALRRWRWYYVWLGLALCCRIDAAFVALALGVVLAVRQRDTRKYGLYTIGLAIAWLAIDFAVVVPAVRQVYGPGTGNLVARRFGELGGGPVQVLRTVACRPVFVLARFVDRDKLQTVFELLVPLGGLSLLSPFALLPGVPVLAINLLAESAWQSSIHAHYMAPVIPFVWIAGVEAIAWLARRRLRGHVPSLVTFVFLNTVMLSWTFSPFPPGKAFRLADFYQPSSYTENVRAVTALVPDGASVCAQSDLHPHLSQRRDACLFPRCQLDQEESAEYVILDMDPTAVKSPLGYHAFYELVHTWLEDESYAVVAQEGGVLLLRRGADRERMPAVWASLEEYGQQFYRMELIEAQVPARLRTDQLYQVSVTLRNVGSGCWHSRGQLPVRLSYHWGTELGPVLTVDSLRTDLPHRVDPGHTVRLRAWLLTPAAPGEYTLTWDLLREGDAWFGDMGAEIYSYRVRVD